MADPTYKDLAQIEDRTNNVVYNVKAKGLESSISFSTSGDVTGTSQSSNLSGNVTIPTTIGSGKVTESKIATDAVTTSKIKDSNVTYGKIDPNAYGGSIAEGSADKLATKVQVKQYVEGVISGQGTYRGKQTVATINSWTLANLNNGDRVMVDGSGTVTIDGHSLSVRDGEDLTLWKFVDGGVTHAYWQSHDGEFKLKQTAKSDPTASGTTITAIDSISQNENGDITASKKTIRSATTSQTGVVQLLDSHTSTATDKAATPKNVKEAYDLASGKQDPITFDGTYDALTNKAATVSTVTNAVNALDAEKTSSDGTNVQVKVTEVDGKITAVNITTDNTENRNNKVTSWSSTVSDTKYPSEKLVKDTIDAISSSAGSEAEVTAAALDDLDARVRSVEDAVNETNIGERTADVLDAQVLKIGGEDVSEMLANKVAASETNGNIKIDGEETVVYTHPTTTSAVAAAVKVGKDGLGHVVLGAALVKGDVGLGNVDNTSDANKPISNATQAALDEKVSDVKIGSTSIVSNKVAIIPDATDSAKGVVKFMTAAEAAQLWSDAWGAA